MPTIRILAKRARRAHCWQTEAVYGGVDATENQSTGIIDPASGRKRRDAGVGVGFQRRVIYLNTC